MIVEGARSGDTKPKPRINLLCLLWLLASSFVVGSGLGSDGRPCRRQLAGVSLVEAVVYCHLAIVLQPLSIVNVMIQTL